jgi:autotransporter-associated beta strand protein
MLTKICFFTFLLTISCSFSVQAAVRTWDGGGADANWATAANWVGDVAPVAGDDLVFPAVAPLQSNNNNFPLFTNFNSIKVEGGAYTISGNLLSIGAGGLTVEAGSLAINIFAIRLSAAQTIRAVPANAVITIISLQTQGNALTVDGNGQVGIGLISGGGGLTKRGLGAVLLAAASGFSGVINIENGIVAADGNFSASPVNVNGGALGGTGTVGAVTVTQGAVSAGTLTSLTGVLNINGSLSFAGASGLAGVVIKIAGATPGANGYDQINVTGAVNLTGSSFVPVPFNNFVPPIGSVYTIINNDGADAVTGTFANVPENGVFAAPNGLAFRVSYAGGTGNDVTVTRVAFAPNDFDGDGKTDVAVFRPAGGNWFRLNSSNGGFAAVQWSASGDKPTPADFDGDGKVDIAVFRPSNGTWYILRSSDNAFQAVPFGSDGDVPVPADYDGDGRRDIAVFRPSNGSWYQLRSATGQFFAEQFGTAGDVPVPADFDSDARANIAVFRPSTGVWFICEGILGGGGVRSIAFGTSGDKPVPADFDGDGETDIAVYRAGSASNFYVLRSSDNAVTSVSWGTTDDLPTIGDYDGDGKPDISVFRPSNGTWYTLLSTNSGFQAIPFGASGDVPLPAAYIP